MRLLLLKDVGELGHVGDIVEVTIGYARNYLIPQRLAADPTEENIQAIAQDRKRAAAERAKRLKEFHGLAQQLTDVTVTIEAAANPEGTLYGSVGPREIAAGLQALGYPVRAEHVALDTPIRTLDNRVINLRFTDEITTQIKLWVVRAGVVEDGEPGGEPESDLDTRFRPEQDDSDAG